MEQTLQTQPSLQPREEPPPGGARGLGGTPDATHEVDLLLDILPRDLRERLRAHPSLPALIEVVLDLGRLPEARFPDDFEFLGEEPVSRDELAQVVLHVSRFGKDNRAGVERTLHRISCIRNRVGDVVGLTCRVGRAVYGTIQIIRDIVESGQSLLLLGRPGVGKTTMLREIARVLADDMRKRVVVVDTSNEIAGDGDIPHSGIGHARRMQVPEADLQHAVMIEAVENHMPQVIVVDEIGTEQEAYASRTIAERGVQLVATAHGTTLENVLMNPTLSDLVGGIQAVTLGDEEARRRGTQKTVLERKAPPTFDVVVEIQAPGELVVHAPVSDVIDQMLRGGEPQPEVRRRDAEGNVEVIAAPKPAAARSAGGVRMAAPSYPVPPEHRLVEARIFPYAVSRNRLERAIQETRVSATIVRTWEEADLVLTLKGHERRDSARVRSRLGPNVPIYVLKSNTVTQMEMFLRHHFVVPEAAVEEEALREAEEGIRAVLEGGAVECELSPQPHPLRRLQHELAEKHRLRSRSKGVEPKRRVLISKE